MLSPFGIPAAKQAPRSDGYDAEPIIPPDWPKSVASR